MSMKKIPVAPCSNLITGSQTSRDLRSFVCKPFESGKHSRAIATSTDCPLSVAWLRYTRYWDAYGRATVVPSSRQTARRKRKSFRTSSSFLTSDKYSLLNNGEPLPCCHVYGQAAVTYRFPSDHRSQAPSSGVSTWMGDHPGTPRAVGNTWCTGHMAKPRPQVGRVC